MAKGFHEESSYTHFKIDPHLAYTSLAQICNSRMGCLLVAQHGHMLTGFLAGAAQELWFSQDRYASDLIFVCRSTGDGARLAKRFIDWAWTVPRTKEVTMAISSGLLPERTGRLYEHLGLTLQGGLYTMKKPAQTAGSSRSVA